MKTDKIHPIGILCVLFICIMMFMSSCATRSPLKDKMFLQTYGMDGQFVITVDASKLDLSEYVDTADSSVSYITNRMSRLSIVLFDKTEQYLEYPADLSTYDYDGAIEGNYSKTLINTALKVSGLFTQQKVILA